VTRAQELGLFKRYYEQGDVDAREQLIRQTLPLARRLASRYSRSGESVDDLVQVASIGLIKAVDRFDPTRGTAFSSFAVPNILGELKRHFRDHGWAAHVPRAVQELTLQVSAAIEGLSAAQGRAPTPTEVAEATRNSVEDVLEAMHASAAYESTSLDSPTSGGDGESATAYVDSVGQVDERYELIEYRSVIASTMRAIPRRERLVLALRFDQDMTQSEIAALIGISQMHVSRLIRRALDRLRAVAEARNQEPRFAANGHGRACPAPAAAYARVHESRP
jgi:RNA polymerase sigma-B factor